jgi:hypothetical protein
VNDAIVLGAMVTNRTDENNNRAEHEPGDYELPTPRDLRFVGYLFVTVLEFEL